MKKIAVIVAGGKGTRMNNDLPKQFMLLKGKPVLYYSIKAFLDAFSDMEIILVLPPEHIGKGKEIIGGYFPRSRFRLCEGGSTRFNSVKNGLALIEDECIIFVHDGVRCLLSDDLVKRCFEAAAEVGSAIPAIDSKDSLRLLTTNGNKMLNRSKVKVIQTPQTFHSKILLPAFNIDYKAKFTDEASVVEEYGLKLNIIEGEENNIKITTPFDIQLAENLLLE